MRIIWRLRIIYSLYMKKNEYSKPAIKVKRLKIRTYLLAGSTDATVPGFTWAKYTNPIVLEEDEEDIDE